MYVYNWIWYDHHGLVSARFSVVCFFCLGWDTSCGVYDGGGCASQKVSGRDSMVGSRTGPLHAPHTTPHSHRPQICTWTAEIDVCRRCLLTGARSRTPHVLARPTTAAVHGSGIYVIMYAHVYWLNMILWSSRFGIGLLSVVCFFFCLGCIHDAVYTMAVDAHRSL